MPRRCSRSTGCAGLAPTCASSSDNLEREPMDEARRPHYFATQATDRAAARQGGRTGCRATTCRHRGTGSRTRSSFARRAAARPARGVLRDRLQRARQLNPHGAPSRPSMTSRRIAPGSRQTLSVPLAGRSTTAGCAAVISCWRSASTRGPTRSGTRTRSQLDRRYSTGDRHGSLRAESRDRRICRQPRPISCTSVDAIRTRTRSRCWRPSRKRSTRLPGVRVAAGGTVATA